MIDFLLNPWPWYFSGPLIALVMVVLLFFGKSFGMSSNLRTLCSIGGAGRYVSFFQFDWKSQKWNLLVVLGSIIGGFIAAQYLSLNNGVDISEQTIQSLQKQGLADHENDLSPEKLFGWSALTSFSGIARLLIGGVLVGFGARWAGGCTSGHAISGLSNLQMPSLIAVIGFFLGGLIMTFLIFPYLF